MNKKSRLLMFLAALLVVPSLFLPLWIIDLDAPQYPEGLGIYIWADQVTGIRPNDLNTLNGLNHYIGMKVIDNDSIPELKIMPYIIIGFVLAGIAVALIGKRNLILGWLALLIVIGGVGIYDFYLWGYDYGHNLDPNAPIKVPGFSYQPPLIGTKQLLNMYTTSLPYLGSAFIGAGFLLALYTYIRSGKKSKNSAGLHTAVLLLPALLALNCSDAPKPIDYGNANCLHCEMTVMDPKFGAELITAKGKVHFFDSAECLAEYLTENKEAGEGAQIYVTDLSSGKLTNARTASFFTSPEVNSPMGGNLAAFEQESAISGFYDRGKGKVLSWQEVIQLNAE
jgi:copper chaperone NosL